MRKPKRADHRRRRPHRSAHKTRRSPSPAKWSARVTRSSDALDLERKVFNKSSPSAIAQSLKRSAEQSRRRKSAPFRSAMSMLNFYINRAGKSLSEARLGVLNRTKGALRKAFGRSEPHR